MENRRKERYDGKQNRNETSRVSYRRYVRDRGHKPWDTLRFYEKKGIIKSRKKENGYRYYLEEDILRLMFIVYRRKMNQSLEEIERYIKEENSLECMKDHLAMRIKQEEASIQYHQQAIARMQLAERDMDQAEKYEGKYTFKNFPQLINWGFAKAFLRV